MQWTKGQSDALEMISSLRSAEAGSVGVLLGYAGTGKTTLIREIAQNRTNTIVLAPTGKAALRVEEATGHEASTIHRWLYRPFEDEEGEVHFARCDPKGESFAGTHGALIVIDEASMVGRRLWEDLEAVARENRNRILLVGDDYQLPPIESGWNALEQRPAHFARLDEIVRQAMNSPIVVAASAVRTGEPIPYAIGKLPVTRGVTVQHQVAAGAREGSPILVYTNRMRQSLNSWVRHKLGKPPRLSRGEPLLVLLNSYDLGVFNGEIVAFQEWTEEPGSFSTQIEVKRKTITVPLGIAMVRIGETAQEVVLAVAPEYVPSAWLREAAEEEARTAFGREIHFLHADLGYVLTCHKAQGSEWPDVLVMLEPQVYHTAEGGRRFIYTAITRAKQTCRILVPPWNFDIPARRFPALAV